MVKFATGADIHVHKYSIKSVGICPEKLISYNRKIVGNGETDLFMEGNFKRLNESNLSKNSINFDKKINKLRFPKFETDHGNGICLSTPRYFVYIISRISNI